MAETPKMKKSKVSYYTTPKSKQLDDHLIEPLTPHISTPTPRRSLRLRAATPDPTPRRNAPPPLSPTTISITPASPQPTEYKRKRKLQEKRVSADFEKKRESRSGKCSNAGDKVKKRVYYKKVVYDGGEFFAGDDVYVKRREDASSDNDDPEVEECRVCFKPAGRRIMIELDDCLNGFHLKCLKPPLKGFLMEIGFVNS